VRLACARKIAVADRLLTADQLAETLGVARSFVYDHADELGAYRLGSGPRARLRFDLDEVRRRTSCSVSRESSVTDPAPRGVARRRERRRMGTNIELLPIRGRKDGSNP
jgi:hypothetical protein